MRKIRFVGLRILIFAVIVLGLGSLVTWWLWDALMPTLFGLHAIGYWQAMGLMILARLLFGGLGRGWGRARRARFVRGWHNLSPEERQRFRQAMGTHWPSRFRDEPPAPSC